MAYNFPQEGSLKQRYQGILSIFISTLLFGTMSVLVKMMPGDLSGQSIAFFRFLTGAILSALSILVLRQTFRIRDPWDVLLRGITGSSSMIFYFMAIQMGASGRATLLNRTAPFFVALWGVLIFRKKLYWWQLMLIIVCFGGVALLFYDGSTYPLGGDLMALLSALLLGMGIHYTQRSRVNNEPSVIYLVLCIAGMLFSAPFTDFQAIPYLSLWPWLLAIGAVSWLAQILFSWAFRYISALEGSMISYLHIPFTLTGSVLLLHETLTPRFYWGMGIILAGLLVFTWLEQKRLQEEVVTHD